MSKQKNEMLKLILLIIFILSIPLIFISLETIQKIKTVSSMNPEEIVTNSLDELYENIITSSKNDDPSTIRKYLTEIFNLMNNKKFDKLYTLLTDDIKDHLFPTEAEFIEHMESLLDNKKYSPSFSKYEKLTANEDTIFIITTNYLPYSTSKEDIKTTTSPEMTDTFIIFEKPDSTYKFSFSGYIGKGKSSEKQVTENIYIKLSGTHLYTSKTIFDIEITNNSPHTLYIEEKTGINTYTGFMPKFYSSKVLIPENTTETISFTIYTGLSLKTSLPSTLYFNGVQINENVHFFTLPINYPIKFY